MICSPPRPRPAALRLWFTPFGFLCALLGLLAAGPAWAGVVTSLADDGTPGTLRSQILGAAAGDTITFQPGLSGTIVLDHTRGTLTLSRGLIIQGPGAGVLTIDGGLTPPSGDVRVFTVTGGVVNISGLTIQHGGDGADSLGGGGIRNTSSSPLTLTACTLTNNSANYAGASRSLGYGGGIYNASGSTLRMTDCTLTGNTAVNPAGSGGTDYGGGLSNFGTATLMNCTLTNNSSGTGNVDGYAGALYNGGNAALLTLTGCTISGNHADLQGGAVYNSGGTLMASGCTLTGNSAGSNYFGPSGYGGGVFNSFGGAATLTSCTVSGNTAFTSGGGLYNQTSTSTMTVTNCTLTANSAGNSTKATDGIGGGIENDSGTLTLMNSTISGNNAAGIGGSSSGGGGVFNTIGGTAALTGCAITGNRTGASGGGVCNSAGTLTLTACTVTGNSAATSGALYNAGQAALTNCTLTANSSRNYDSTSGGATTLTNDILYSTTPDSFGSVTEAYCDIQGNPAPPAHPDANHNFGADPQFVRAPGTNGPTDPGDLHLQRTSPVRGKGTSAAPGFRPIDLDGKPYASPPSIGAYEVAGGLSHLLWNNSDGRVMLWSVAADGTFTLNGFGPYTDGAPQNKWSATAVATGADGLSHLLWNNTDGRVMLWTVDDSGNFTLAGYGPYTDNAPGNVWHATAVSVGPDNVVHLLWNNTDHRVMLWNVAQDFSFTLAGYGPYTDSSVTSDSGNLWSATALSTGPDGVSRIAWNNVDGRVMLWNVNADFTFTLAGYGPYTDGAPQNKWSAVGVSVGPDNMTHLLWSNTDRRAMFWNVAADFSFTLAGYGPYTDNAPQNLWTATALATGPDNISHILWGNTDNRAMLWGVDNSFSFTVAGYGPYTDGAPQNQWSVTAVSAGP